jgi:FkbM family methyltransferase
MEDLRLSIDKSDPVCLDIGANEGQTIVFLQQAFEAPIIHAFEPARSVFQRLKSSHSNDDVRVYNLALGSEPGEKEFIDYNDPCLSSILTLEEGAERHFTGSTVSKTERVSIDTIDRFLTRADIAKVDILKVDTQGYDLQVLEGAEKSLRNGIIRCVIVELNFVPIYRGQCSPTQIMDYLSQHAFQLVDLYGKHRQRNALAWCDGLFLRDCP